MYICILKELILMREGGENGGEGITLMIIVDLFDRR
jgi:hypothetical protein